MYQKCAYLSQESLENIVMAYNNLKFLYNTQKLLDDIIEDRLSTSNKTADKLKNVALIFQNSTNLFRLVINKMESTIGECVHKIYIFIYLNIYKIYIFIRIHCIFILYIIM